MQPDAAVGNAGSCRIAFAFTARGGGGAGFFLGFFLGFFMAEWFIDYSAAIFPFVEDFSGFFEMLQDS